MAPSATVVGDVRIGKDTCLWYGSVIRGTHTNSGYMHDGNSYYRRSPRCLPPPGDVNSITIGDGVTVGDRAMVHCSGTLTKSPTSIGNRVVIGSGSIIHGCTIEDESYIGAGAQVLDGAKVLKNAMVAAGAVVPSGKTVPSRQLWAGVPATYLRDLTNDEVESIKRTADENKEWARTYAAELAKTWSQTEDDTYEWGQINGRNESYYKRLTPEQLLWKAGALEDGSPHPGRLFNAENAVKGPADDHRPGPPQIRPIKGPGRL